MSNPTITQVLAWEEQIEQDAVKWVTAHGGKHSYTDQEIVAYRADVREGTRRMRAVLTLHGHLVTKGA